MKRVLSCDDSYCGLGAALKSDDSESQGQQGGPKQLVHGNQPSKSYLILVQIVTEQDKVYNAGRIEGNNGADNKVFFLW
jgi:hypothetical protein